MELSVTVEKIEEQSVVLVDPASGQKISWPLGLLATKPAIGDRLVVSIDSGQDHKRLAKEILNEILRVDDAPGQQ